jgi:hypothetical protein
MQSFVPGAANTVHADMVARADGTPIIAGTVNVYLIALTGDNAGKWFKTSDDSWSAVEASAGTATHKADAHWTGSIDAAAWIQGVRYLLYAKESGDLHVPYSEEVIDVNHTLQDMLGCVGGKKIVNAAGTQVQIYDRAGALFVTLDRTGSGPYTWTPTWA